MVTGASKGIGRGIATGLAAAGWDVCVNFQGDMRGAEETAKAVRAAGRTACLVQADVGEAAQVKGDV